MEKQISFLIKNKFLISLIAFLIGVFVSSFVFIGLSTAAFLIFLALIVLCYAFRLPELYKKLLISVSILVILFSLGVLRYQIKNSTVPDAKFLSFIGKNVSIDSIIVNEPQNKETYRQYIILAPGGKEKVLVRADLYPEFDYGDEVTFKGKLTLPENFETDSGEAFDYTSYLRKDNIRYILSFAKGELVKEGKSNSVKKTLYVIKNEFLKNINESLTEPQSSLLAGILLGVDSLGKETEDAFRKTGIVHIVVLSGYNITIVAENLVKFFSFLPRNFALGSGIFGIIIFAIMVGGAPSVLRASLMAILVLIARATGRTYDIGRALLIAGFLMVLWNPNILVFDVSFQLSFLSTIALIWISPFFERKLLWIPEKWGLRDIASATISTQIFVLPLLLYKIGEFSIVGLPVNLLVLVVVPAIMFFGFFTGLLGFISSILAIPFAFITRFLLTYVLKVVDLFAVLPFASIRIPFFSTIVFWVVYILYGYLFWKIKKRAAPARF